MERKMEVGMQISEVGLREKKVRDVTGEKRRLVEVPCNATIAHTLNALVANRVAAVPVAAPPGHWIGAGGSMIMETDKHTGAVRKQYIGMVTMVDILAHIASGDGDEVDFEGMMSVPVSSVIGHTLEGLSLWTLNSNTSILECMEMLSKGIHRALVPIESRQMDNISGVEVVELACSYRMVTQMDVLRYIKEHGSEVSSILSRSIRELGVIQDTVFGVSDGSKLIEAIKCMKPASLNAVPIIQASHFTDHHSQLINGRGRKLTGTLSATDLRGCPVTQLGSWLSLNVMDFKNKVGSELVTCFAESCLGEAVDKVVNKHVHRVWVVDGHGLLLGLVSLTDMIRVIRLSLISDTLTSQ